MTWKARRASPAADTDPPAAPPPQPPRRPQRAEPASQTAAADNGSGRGEQPGSLAQYADDGAREHADANPVWIEDDAVDLDYHVQRVRAGLARLYGRADIGRTVPPLANLVISNVPGPQVPLYSAGARMLTYWTLSIAEHGVGLNVTVMSYAGTMGFGVTTARNAVPDARELSAARDTAVSELVAASGRRPVRAQRK